MARIKQKVLLLTLDIEHASQGTIRTLLADARTESTILDRIAKIYSSSTEMMKTLIRHPHLGKETALFLFKVSKDLREFLLSIRPEWLDHDGHALMVSKGAAAEAAAHEQEESVYSRIQVMTVAEKIQFALKADKEARSILFKDSNRQVALAVLGSPKLTEEEVALMAQSRNVAEEVLRVISKNRQWMKNYAIVLGLVNNPKTPISVAIAQLTRLKQQDLNTLARSRSVSEALRSGANRTILAREKRS